MTRAVMPLLQLQGRNFDAVRYILFVTLTLGARQIRDFLRHDLTAKNLYTHTDHRLHGKWSPMCQKVT